MERILLEDTKIGENLAVGVEQRGDEIGLTIVSYKAMTVYGMEIEIWKEFVKSVNRANIILKLEDLTN
ncbi:hypothetical protein ES705_30888 [subsurface metagenome]